MVLSEKRGIGTSQRPKIALKSGTTYVLVEKGKQLKTFTCGK